MIQITGEADELIGHRPVLIWHTTCDYKPDLTDKFCVFIKARLQEPQSVVGHNGLWEPPFFEVAAYPTWRRSLGKTLKLENSAFRKAVLAIEREEAKQVERVQSAYFSLINRQPKQLVVIEKQSLTRLPADDGIRYGYVFYREISILAIGE